MADLTRGTRPRRGARRPGWLLLTVLLVLAIGASSALVFTNSAELLKLAVILALWAAVVAAFVSVIYRRQSDIDQAKVRDLKLVYDLQLDREISARREYELSVETQLRRELTSEIRAQAADEVAGLRAELAALRANLEILFDADLSHRPALETDRARAYADWPREAESTGRVTASRIDTEDREDVDANTEESPIIDVPAEPHPPEAEWAPLSYGGAHRRPSETEQEEPAPSRRGGAARVVTSAAATSAGAGQSAHTRVPIRLAATATRAPARAADPTATATAAPRAGAGRADAADGLAARSRGGTVDTRGNSGKQLGVACRAGFAGSAGTRRIRRLSRQLPIRRLSRPCRHRQPPAAATRHRRTPSIRDAHRRRPLWPPNPGVPRHTPSPRRSPNRRQRSRRRGDTAARRTPAGSRLPSCWRGFMPPRREAAVAGVARSELGS